MGRITWVCATCSEHFTRQYGANRHNNTLHHGNGVIVRLLDYMVGVANGKFKPQAKKKQTRGSFFTSNSRRLNSGYDRYGDPSVVHESDSPEHSNKQVYFSRNTYGLAYSTQPLTADRQSAERPDQGKVNNLRSAIVIPPFNDNLQTKKLEEIRELLNKNFPPEQAKQYSDMVSCMAYAGNHNDIDRILSYLSAYNNFFGYLQQASDKHVENKMSPERYLQGKNKLEAIERLLSAHYPREFVRNIIAGLTTGLELTGDLSALDEAFQNHLKNIRLKY